MRFEGEGRGVFGEDVVEEGGVLDGEEHGGGRCCNYIACEQMSVCLRIEWCGMENGTSEIEGCWSGT